MSKPTIPSTEALGTGLVNGGSAPEVLAAHIITQSLAAQRGEPVVTTPASLDARLEHLGDGKGHFEDLDENGELILD